jgi:hypothetical protein
MSRKDYTDNWESEMHETFCFWDFEEWKLNLERVGFSISERSNAYTNNWIVNNRLKGKVVLFKEHSSALERIDFPVTNMIMLAIKK